MIFSFDFFGWGKRNCINLGVVRNYPIISNLPNSLKLMQKKTVIIPAKLISSAVVAFILTIILLVSFHYFGKWHYNAFPDYSNTSMGYTTPIYNGLDNTCILLDKTHHASFAEQGKNTFDIPEMQNLSSFKFRSSLNNTFDKHTSPILLLTLLLTVLIFILKTVKFQVK